MSLIDKMKERVMDIINPDVEYTQEDFNKEFSKANINTENYKLSVNFVNTSNNPNPEYATAGSSGFDLRASLTDAITIPTGKRAIVPTGLFFQIPDNFEITVRSRSGLAAKNGVVVLNSPGTIDSDYNGEVKVILINLMPKKNSNREKMKKKERQKKKKEFEEKHSEQTPPTTKAGIRV